MTIATLTTKTTWTKESFTGVFDEKPMPPISYGQAGFLQPDKFILEISTTVEVYGEKERKFVSYMLNLISIKPSVPTSFTASFCYPSKGTVSSYDYGYGYGGYIQEVNPEVIEAVTAATGFDLTTLVAEILSKK